MINQINDLQENMMHILHYMGSSVDIIKDISRQDESNSMGLSELEEQIMSYMKTIDGIIYRMETAKKSEICLKEKEEKYL